MGHVKQWPVVVSCFERDVDFYLSPSPNEPVCVGTKLHCTLVIFIFRSFLFPFFFDGQERLPFFLAFLYYRYINFRHIFVRLCEACIFARLAATSSAEALSCSASVRYSWRTHAPLGDPPDLRCPCAAPRPFPELHPFPFRGTGGRRWSELLQLPESNSNIDSTKFMN